MPLDPYEELDVPRDATSAVIKKAARKRAKKTHPDAGGSDEAFQRTMTALAVLEDPKRRDQFDRTGKFDEAEVDNDRAVTLQIIEKFMADLVNQFINAGFAPSMDPRKMDVSAVIIGKIEDDIRQAESSIKIGTTAAEFFKDMGKRFVLKAGGADSPISRSFEVKSDSASRQVEGLKKSIKCLRDAILLLETHDFRSDPPDPPPTFSDSTFYGSTFKGFYVR